MNEILRDNQEESQDDKPDISATGSKSLLLESTQKSALRSKLPGQALQASGKKLSVMTAGETFDGGKSNISRLADSALKNLKL